VLLALPGLSSTREERQHQHPVLLQSAAEEFRAPPQLLRAILETPHQCRLIRHHAALADFVSEQIHRYLDVEWRSTGVDPRLLVVQGDRVLTVVRLDGLRRGEVQRVLEKYGFHPGLRAIHPKEDL